MSNKRVRVGINGFGRIGRAIFRRILRSDICDVVVINELNDELEGMSYVMKYDTLHGILDDEIAVRDDCLVVNGEKINTYNERAIEDVPWNKHDVDIVIGCTGSLLNVDNAKKCLGKSVKKVVFSDSPSNVDITIVMGVNDEQYDHDNHDVIAASICDVVGTAPVIKLLQDNIGIESGYFLTLHPWLYYQNLLDGWPSSPSYKDHPGTYLAMGRGSVNTMIPKQTSIVPALERIFPSLQDKTTGMSFRVPTDLVSSAYMSLRLNGRTNVDEVKEIMKGGVVDPVLGYTEEPLVSSDYRHSKYSAIIDGKWIEVQNGKNKRLISWYDNEWGYAANVLGIISHISKHF